ncbi:MAG: phospho-sugar mutase [Deltaproteobacteria bacterium]|nr:phospho-sugar mutase [Deltaproteobacteria bacterium]
MDQNTALKLLDFYKENGEIDQTTYDNAHKWLTDPAYKAYRDDIHTMLRPLPLIDAFYQTIPFGTGGRRGTVGAGSNRINERTIGESAQGYADYINAVDKGGKLAKRGVAVAYDVRPHSKKFGRLTAEVLAGNGIRVFLFDSPRSTPELSFAVRRLGCVGGVVLTASHNPPADNGFKCYWDDGGQVVAPHDREILKRVGKVAKIAKMPLAQAKKKGLVKMISKEVDKPYIARFADDHWLCDERAVKIFYSPLHGTGVTIIPDALKSMGFTDVVIPADQAKMDGTFPTVPNRYPNPEEPAALEKAVLLAKQVGADIVMGSDPDADRLGVHAPDKNGEFHYVSGNRLGAAMAHFVLESLKERGELPKNPTVMTTMVSTQLATAVAKKFKAKIVNDLLVGFKYVAQELRGLDAKGKTDSFVFGFEESIGFLRGPAVRDKDSASAAVIMAQLMARLNARGMTFWDYLDEIYTGLGYFADAQKSVVLKGADGSAKMGRIMTAFRENPPKSLAGNNVHVVIDRQAGTMKNLKTGKTKKISGDKGNVVQLWLDEEGKSRLSIRPSGTEPKIKHYASAYVPVKDAKALAAAKKAGDRAVEAILKATEEFETKVP